VVATSALVVIGVLAVAFRRPPPDEGERIAAILARRPVDPGIDRADLENEVRMYVGVRRDLEPFVAAAAKHTRVSCGPSRNFGLCADILGRYDIYGGYSTCREDIFTHDGDVAEMHLDCTTTYVRWPGVVPFALDALEGVGEPGEHGLRYVFRDVALLAKAHADVAADLGLGPLEPVPVPPDLANAYDTLTSPFVGLDLGLSCGDPGRPGRGHAETETLVKAGRFDLLRNVARNLNRAGRVFAALALYEHARPWTAGDVAIIQRIRALPDIVVRCAGCSADFVTAAAVLPDPSAPPKDPR
jgi:hypothetical protein